MEHIFKILARQNQRGGKTGKTSRPVGSGAKSGSQPLSQGISQDTQQSTTQPQSQGQLLTQGMSQVKLYRYFLTSFT